MRKISSYFKGVAIEAKRIRWPRKKQLWVAVGTVCIIAVLAALIIAFEDWLTIQILRGFDDALSSAASSAEAA